MEQQQDLVHHPCSGGARLGLGSLVRAVEDRLDELEIPVAEHVPHELVEGARRLVELVFTERLANLRLGAGRLPRDPAVHRHARRQRIMVRVMRHAVHLGETCGVPQLGAEVAVTLDARLGQLDVATLRGHGGEGKAQRVRAIGIDQFERVNDVALRLRHLLALLVADQGVDVDGVERHLMHEVQPHHHHPGNPEEDDVEAGDQHVGLVVPLQLRRLLGPAERRKRPQRGGEPSIEHVLVTRQADARAIMALGGFEREALGFFDEHRIVRSVPGRNLVAPPQLARDAPRLDVAHPFEIGLLPVLRDEAGLALLNRRDGGLRQFAGVHIPLLGQPRLDHHIRTVAMRHLVGVRLDLVKQAERLEHLDDALARLETIKAVQRHGRGGHVGAFEEIGVAVERDLAELVEHVDLAQVVALAHVEVVEVMRRRDLDGTRTLLGVGIIVADDGNEAADQRQLHLLADEMLQRLVLRVHGDT